MKGLGQPRKRGENLLVPIVCQVFTVIPLNLCKYLRVLVVDLNYGKEQTEAMKYRLFSQGLRN